MSNHQGMRTRRACSSSSDTHKASPLINNSKLWWHEDITRGSDEVCDDGGDEPASVAAAATRTRRVKRSSHLCPTQKKSNYLVNSRTYNSIKVFHSVVTVFVLTFFRFCCSTTEAKIFSTQLGPTIVETQYGKLRGMLVTLSNKNLGQVEAYYGLQYASLLGGQLRFLPPTSTQEKWDNIKAALQHRPVCPQIVPTLDQLRAAMPTQRVEHFKRLLPFVDKQSEECLYLNVFVPVRDKLFMSSPAIQQQQQQQQQDDQHRQQQQQQQQQEQLPSLPSPPSLAVVVFIHGDSYEMGTGNAYDGSAMAASGQHIVVTINFRLGVLGFLSTEDASAPGNYGLLDQVAALRWVHENIGSFGGDPYQVTLMGHGCGAAMVNMLASSPIVKGRGLFNRIILQSGTATSPWATVRNPKSTTRKLSVKARCLDGAMGQSFPAAATTKDGENFSQYHPIVVECLKKMDLEYLIKNVSEISSPRFLYNFGPYVDGRVVPALQGANWGSPTLLQDGLQSGLGAELNFSIMAGFALGEGQSLFNQTILENGLSQESMARIVRTFIHNSFQFHRQTILDILLHQYRNWESSGQTLSATEVRNSLYELLGDAMYASPAIKLASMASDLGFNQPEDSFSRGSLDSEGILAPKFGDFESGQSDFQHADDHDDYKTDSTKVVNSVKVYVYCYNRSFKESQHQQQQQQQQQTGTANATAAQSQLGQQQPSRHESASPGSVHGEDLAFAFAAPITDGISPFTIGYTWQDKSFNEAMLKYWSNFIRTGSPNDNSGLVGTKSKSGRLTPNLPSIETVHWPAYDISSQQIMLLESQKFSVKAFYRASKMALWLDLLPNIHRTSHHLDQCTYNQLDNSENTTYFDGNLLFLPCPQDKFGRDKNNVDSKSLSSPSSSSSSKRAHQEPDSQTQPNSSPANAYSNRKLSNKILSQVSTPSPQQNKHTIFQSLTSPGLFSSFQFVENNRQRQKPEGQDFSSHEYGGNEAEETLLPDGSSKTIVRSVHTHSGAHQYQNLPLVVVIGVGCVLLSGNIFLFLAVYCRKRRRGRRKNACSRSSNFIDSDTADQYYRKQQQQPQKFGDTAPHCNNDHRRDLKPLPRAGHGSLGRSYKHQVHNQDSPLFAGDVSPYHASRDDSSCLKAAVQSLEHSEGTKTYPSRLSRPSDATCHFETASSCQKGVKFSDSEIAASDSRGPVQNQTSHLQLILGSDPTIPKHGGGSTHCYNNNSVMLDQHPSNNQTTLLKTSTMKNTTIISPHATSSSFSTVFPSAPNQQPTKLLSMSSSNYICSRPVAVKNHLSPATKISETAIDCDIMSDTTTTIPAQNFNNSSVRIADGMPPTFHDPKSTYASSYLHHASSSSPKPLLSFNSSPISTSSKRDADV